MLYERQRFSYEYGIVGGWTMEVRVERFCEMGAGGSRFRYISGKRAASPEACGGAEAFAWLQELFTPAYVNERMQSICVALLTEELLQPEWTAEIAEIQHELEELRYWLSRESFSVRETNRRLQQVTNATAVQRVGEVES